MFKVKLYKYDSSQENNGYRGQDFSKHILQGNQETEDISQEMDVGEITLCGLPFSNEFDPHTKFIVDLVEYIVLQDNTRQEIIRETRHFCVDRDVVSKPVLSAENYYDHHISLIEPSVIAQSRLVDNISATYKLKDVNLEERPAFPQTVSKINLENGKIENTTGFPFGYTMTELSGSGSGFTTDEVFGKYFSLSGELQYLNRNGNTFTNVYNNIESFKTDDGYKARINIPRLQINTGVIGSNSYHYIGDASIDYKVEEFDLNGENPLRQVVSGQIISNSALESSNELEILQNEWLIERFEKEVDKQIATTEHLFTYYKKYTETTAPIPSYVTPEFEILPDKRYVLTISLHQFNDNVPSDKYSWSEGNRLFNGSTPNGLVSCNLYSLIVVGPNLSITQYHQYTVKNQSLTTAQSSGTATLITYSVDTKKIVYASATPYSALALLQKAIINSSIYEKKDGVYIADINNSQLPFYIDPNYIDELSATLIIENFYNQKNLWEIMVEVGNYIHAIPELRFGSDNRFEITFNKLGQTTTQYGGTEILNAEQNTTPVSIFNSRSVEDYICATSSYITNMVQLGGYIEEWVAPKTTNEQLLVYNDTAEIIVSKPIIELMEIKVRNNTTNEIASMTEFIFEENVYKTLSLDYQVYPNRGIAMYYSLGTNVITGGQYRLPQENTNIYSDYTIKKVIWCAFHGYNPVSNPEPTGEWTYVDVKDYSFYIKYRTKDSVRQNHIRPDIRKYLLNSKYDKFPEHNQFNNQTDTVVDSIKFGNNMFGKLIRTGNSSYEIWEWHDNYEDLKHKGQLYRVNGELYYVSRVTHYYYNSYILSKIEYSKDYNELSKVIGIPSEPRFYEISEQSLIWRELAISDMLLLTDDVSELDYTNNYLFTYYHLADLMFKSSTDFAKYAITVYKGDKDSDKYTQTVGVADFYLEVMNPINAYSSENTLTYEWDMVDNYSAGDKNISTDKPEYQSLRAVPYTDVYGKAELLDFYIIENLPQDPTTGETLTAAEIQALPESPISTKDNPDRPVVNGETADNRPFIGNCDILATNVAEYNNNFNGRGIGLLKDCREAMSINYNLQLMTNSDTFVVSPYVFLPQKQDVKIVLLTDEVNKLSTGYINNSQIITPTGKDGTQMEPYFNVTITPTTITNEWGKSVVSQFSINLSSIFSDVADGHFTGEDGLQRVKAIAVLCNVSLNAGVDTEAPTIPYKTQFVVARNIPEDWDRTKALKSFIFGAPKKDAIFKNKQ